MDDQRVGRIVRALRRRLGWRQLDLAEAAGCSQAMVSLVERGHLERVALRTVRRLLASLDANVVLEVRWRAGMLERLLDEDHAALVGRMSEILRRAGWEVLVEVSYSEYGERGSYDILAYHADTRTLLVVEVKTELPSAEAALRKLDEKTRLAPKVARERAGWEGADVSRLLILAEDRSARRLVVRHGALLDLALPDRTVAVKRWLARPAGSIRGLMFVTSTNGRSGIQRRGGRIRVRRPRQAPSAV